MHRYIIKRLLFLIPTVLGVTLIIYIVMNITPGNPGRMILGPNATAAEVEAMNDELGYNDPVLVRWFNYLKNIITEGDFGESYSTKLNVLDELWPRFLITLRLAILVLVLSVCIGVPLGILSAVKQNSLLDTIPTMIAFFLAAVPSFVVGILLMYVFALKLGWFPSFGLKSVKHYVLPVIAATICELSAYLRFTKSGVHPAGLCPYRPRQGRRRADCYLEARAEERAAARGHVHRYALRLSAGRHGHHGAAVLHPRCRLPDRGVHQHQG